MTDALKIALITTAPLYLGHFLNWWKLHKVSQSVDGVKDELVETTRKGAFAAGQKDEKDNPS